MGIGIGISLREIRQAEMSEEDFSESTKLSERKSESRGDDGDRVLDAHSKLMLYLKGWTHGAGRKAIHHEDQPVYMEGYNDGYRAYGEAAVKAQERFGATLSVLRIQENEGVKDEP